MDDRKVAGEMDRQLCQKHSWPQVAHQTLVEIGSGIRRVLDSREDIRVDVQVTLAPSSSNDHIHTRENVGLALHARGVEGKAGRVGADTLPVLHLTLITFLGDLRVKIGWRERMDNKRRKRC